MLLCWRRVPSFSERDVLAEEVRLSVRGERWEEEGWMVRGGEGTSYLPSGCQVKARFRPDFEVSVLRKKLTGRSG